MGLGRTIRDLRLAKGWTLDELEERTGVARGTISAIEMRDSSRSEFFPALAKAFGLTVEQLSDPRAFEYDSAGRVHVLARNAAPAAQEPEPAYGGWPFPLVDQRRWDALNDQQKGFVQARLQQAISEAESGGSATRAKRTRVLSDARGVLNSTGTAEQKRKS